MACTIVEPPPNADLGQLDPNADSSNSFFIYSPPRTSNALSDLESAIMAVIRTPITDLGQLDPKAHATSNLATPQRDG